MDFAFFEAFRELVGRVELLEEVMLADEDEDEDDENDDDSED